MRDVYLFFLITDLVCVKDKEFRCLECAVLLESLTSELEDTGV